MTGVVFHDRLLPYLLLAPQLAVTAVFFFWPAGQALYQSLLLQDAFGLNVEFAGLENFRAVLGDRAYLSAFWLTLFFSAAVTLLSMAIALALAVMADAHIKGAGAYKTLLIWPYAIAPAIAGVLWLFMFAPSVGVLGQALIRLGIEWNYVLNGPQALALVILATAWKYISYNFLFFLAGLQAIPKSLVEAAAIDGAGPGRRFWTIVFPLISPTTFFLLVVNVVHAFFDSFGVIDTITRGGPGKSTEILVYRIYKQGATDLGGSAAESVILMAIVIALTVIQFRFIERKVHY